MQDDEDAELREDWVLRVATGRPIFTYDFDRPLFLKLHASGQLDVDCPCLCVGNFDLAGVIRIRLSPSAVGQLVKLAQRLTPRGDFEDPYLH